MINLTPRQLVSRGTDSSYQAIPKAVRREKAIYHLKYSTLPMGRSHCV
jgi:hypothetical protein